MNGYNNSDKIMEKFCYLFTLLSLLYEIVTNTNNREEYAILTVWSCANIAIIENRREKKYFTPLDI